MSNKNLTKKKSLAIKHRKHTDNLYPEEIVYSTKYKRFNIFTKSGENRTVTAPRPMTLDEAMNYFDVLSIGNAE